jgi:hypothetical protein
VEEHAGIGEVKEEEFFDLVDIRTISDDELDDILGGGSAAAAGPLTKAV